jgi:hypothetical protein
MKKILCAVPFAAACAFGAFPEAGAAAELFLNRLDERYAEPEGATVSDFVEGETPEQALAVVRVDFGYYAEIYPALFARGAGGWRLADFDDPVNFMPETGGDAGTLIRIRPGALTYYVFTCTEASYGSGMATEYDYYLLYRVDGGELVKAFEGEARVREEYYSRWYGGDDSSSWEYGAYAERETGFVFEDVDGNGTAELWAMTRERAGKDGRWTGLTGELYAAGDDGNFAPADVDSFPDILAATASVHARLVLARAALTEAGDAAAARAFLEEAAALEHEAAEAIEEELKFLERLADDPAEAIRLYYRGGGDGYRALIEQYPETAVGAEAVLAAGDLDALATFLKRRRSHRRWPEAYAYAVRGALASCAEGGYEEAGRMDAKYLSFLKRNLGRYLELAAEAEEKARTLTHLADCFYHAGDFDQAARLYAKSLAVKPDSVFEDYNYLRLGDCAAAEGDHGSALQYYAACAALTGWWSYDGAETSLGYAAVREDGAWLHFLDYLDERGGQKYLAVEPGDLDGAAGDDFAVLVQREEEPHELYYFFRRGDELRGELALRGRPSLWLAKVEAPFDVGPQLLACNETVEDGESRVTHRILYRYDGSRMREVARLKIEETRPSEPDYAYAATVNYADSTPPAVAVNGKVESAAGERAVEEIYRWDDETFAFVRIEP